MRHGETEAQPGIAIGHSDPPLSLAGRTQAKALAIQLAGRPITRIFASDKLRALATAETIASSRLRVEVDRRLREIDFGAWEGRRLADLWVEEPEAAAAWERDVWATPASFGENLAHLEARVQAFWSELRLCDDIEVAVIAHRGSLGVLRALITGTSVKSAFSAGMDMGRAIQVLTG